MFSWLRPKPAGGAGSVGGGSAVVAPNDTFVRLGTIVNSAGSPPTIVNDASKFVVVTYWWGRGNMNPNVARPCLIFYENLLMTPVDFISSKVVMTDEELSKPIEWLAFFLARQSGLKNYYHKQIDKYLRERGIKKEDGEAVYNEQWRFYSKKIFEILKAAFTDPSVTNLLHQLMKSKATYQVAKAEQESFLSAAENTNSRQEIKARIKEMAQAIIQKHDLVLAQIKAELRKYIFGAKAGEPAVPFLESLLQYRPRITYDQMIANWEAQCARVGCNYLAVEYPDFAKPGGYQLAINAKPLFIKRALELCAPRAVLYIDGDMSMNFYPPVFDMDDIDYMARGWRIDPRSSYKHVEGDIHVDPYVFETSGGIMYFSQSHESKRLLDMWIEQSAKPIEKGKADDRIISLIFNTKHLLAPMKIIQLPIEYLWLSMDYDYSVQKIVREKIYVEHPECLTSEDTAASGGAAGSRQPILYSKLLDPMSKKRSELLYESVLFPTKEVADSFRPYLDYLRDEAIYPADDDELPEEQPFYVYPFGNFGDKQATYERNLATALAAPDMCSGGSGTFDEAYTNVCQLNRKDFTIPNILQQLSLGRTVIYYPERVAFNDTARKSWHMKLLDKIFRDPSKNRLEFVFFDKRSIVPVDEQLNFRIDLDQPMMIRPNGPSALEGRLPPLLTMFAVMESVAEIETVFENNYQFLSLIRCHAADVPPQTLSNFIGKTTRKRRQHGGARGGMNTNDAIELLYGPVQPTRSSKTRRTRRFRR